MLWEGKIHNLMGFCSAGLSMAAPARRANDAQSDALRWQILPLQHQQRLAFSDARLA